MNDNLYGVQILNEHECGSFNRNSSVSPFFLFISFSLYFFLFWWPHWLFLFISHLSSFGIFCLSSLGSFPHFKGNNLYFTRSIEDLHTLQEVLNMKKTENYHDVCKCMPLPV